jgi:membrane protease YdiL (CAAX protease family)
MALLAGWLVRRYRAIWPAILLHALINGLAVTLVSRA